MSVKLLKENGVVHRVKSFGKVQIQDVCLNVVVEIFSNGV